LTKRFEDCLERFQLSEFPAEWGKLRRGIEKESLRVSPEGSISLSKHPPSLGSALTNPYITTDFSEALLEFITPANESIDSCLDFLDAIHRYTYQSMENDEVLWVFSMPCPTGNLENIPLALYGNSNIGRLKTLYRRGLSYRYSSLMQTIAGIHYNFSMPDNFWPDFQQHCNDNGSLKEFRTSRYLHLIRNFHRYSWLLIYLFGASPVTCKCFASDRDHHLENYDDGTLYLPNATCLRMGKLGYQSDAQESLFICYNELDTYVESLNSALHTNYAPYEEIGTRANGEYLQINTNLLQLENEFYSSVRPKRTVESGERPLSALLRDGIEYVEVRALDLNPFLPLGIDAEEIRFLDSFLLYCLLSESPPCDKDEHKRISENNDAVVEYGRDPDLKLSKNGEEIKLTDWASALLEDIGFSAGLLDENQTESAHVASVDTQLAKVKDPGLTPSGKILSSMQENDQSFYKFAMAQSEKHKSFFTGSAVDSKNLALFEAASSVSIARQKEIEDSDTMDFDTFLAKWNDYQI
jgi:glutamate--cysteine ligase